ncbi:LuxR C-terminal-related transcriptional regulator [Actinomycetospora endophytica]|uniref:LuxR C-terminal-related transcriptional regulator n=1 Tax=Actinomycetospora endophytica TaxID=2291215 RepID=A0ABS8P5T7_9PSEU|nr:LuxR C-terminal-related transcriptional regulator [Actinomycetospora endophytica]MCD2193620.1 LuxR C-terminal-related transcriptional regulator [Actinomycetospora endophytica]
MAGYLVCEDRAGLRAGLTTDLAAGVIVELVGGPAGVHALDDPDRLVEAWAAAEPEVVVLGAGSNHRRTLAGLRALLAHAPDALVLMAGSGIDHEVCPEALVAGARGYLTLPEPDHTPGPETGSSPHRAAPASEQARPEAKPVLTEPEAELLAGMSRGETGAQLAARLALTPETIKSQTHRMFATLGATNRAAAVAVGFRSGLLT